MGSISASVVHFPEVYFARKSIYYYILFTDYAFLQNEEQLKYVAPPSTHCYVHEQSIWLFFIPIGSIDDYTWRHRGVFLISTFQAHKLIQKYGLGATSKIASIHILMGNQSIPNVGVSLFCGWL